MPQRMIVCVITPHTEMSSVKTVEFVIPMHNVNPLAMISMLQTSQL